ncbi:uncharacterized protein BHQ10_004263 [Talaromyces amestolkiae]|uniref:BTB domain-containing protein n=1 Tax=Talaromyces amestolkiae TaxID=1196081 RepID=A0A364KXN3_TALAM|nr:uncharacterized protein BHQ10_004263 [Talaromyces amestolkiae]RAO68251.1 hypothetical protein BHQ10_004263 [Talaromyces amestolkiae]
MDEPTHVIDPDGEVIIVLKDANSPFAVWPEEKTEDEKSKILRVPNEDTTPQSETEEEETEENCFRIRVSAKHLTLVSPVFKSLLVGGWKESSTFIHTGSTELTVSGWDLEAFLVVMRMIHNQHTKIPRKVSLELFAKIIVIVDYYKCKDAIGFFADVWLDDLDGNSELRNKIACTFSRDLMLWLWISWIFQRSDQFKISTAIAIKYIKAQISSLGLPLPARLIDQLNHEREKGIESVMAALEKQRSFLLSENWPCGYAFQCTSMMLGGLEKYMFTNGLFPAPTAPFDGFGYQDLVDKIRNFEPPTWYHSSNTYGSHLCSGSKQGYQQLKLTTESTVGLNFLYSYY